MDVPELLQRLSGTLRDKIAPAVDDEYARTQAFMASVILERVARQIALGPGHGLAERDDVLLVHSQLQSLLVDASADVRSALAGVAAEPTVASLSPLIEALYESGDPDPALDLIRPVLRADIDRRMKIAK